MVSVLYFSHCIFTFGVSFNSRNHPVYDTCIIIIIRKRIKIRIRYLGLTAGFYSDIASIFFKSPYFRSISVLKSIQWYLAKMTHFAGNKRLLYLPSEIRIPLYPAVIMGRTLETL